MYSPEKLKEKFKLYIDENDETLIVVFFGPPLDREGNVELATILTEEIKVLLAANHARTYNGLVDLALIGDAHVDISTETIKVYSELLRHPQLGKVAFVGSNSFLQIIVNSIISFVGQGDYKWFSDVGEAKSWFSEIQ